MIGKYKEIEMQKLNVVITMRHRPFKIFEAHLHPSTVFSTCPATLFYLLDYVTRRSEKPGICEKQKKTKLVQRHIGEKCLLEVSPKNYLANFSNSLQI